MTEFSVARLRELLNYDPRTGNFTWRVATAKRVKVGHIAGSMHRQGYRKIKIDYRWFLAHRLAWIYMTGAWPKDQIDHINGIKDDNSFANLREASCSENNRNVGKTSTNTSGLKGVRSYRGRWQAQIRVQGKQKHLGTFDTPESAHAAYVSASEKYHGEFSNGGGKP